MKILFSGGGTMGPVVPLLAIHDKLKTSDREMDFLWIGTCRGPEQIVVSKEGIPFRKIYAGKLRRYFSLFNIKDVFLTILGFWQSLWT